MKKTLLVILVVTLLTTLTGCELKDKVEAKMKEEAILSLRDEVDSTFIEDGWTVVKDYDNGQTVWYQTTENGMTLDVIMYFAEGSGKFYINGDLMDELEIRDEYCLN
jgi:hypothetical protein